MYAVKMALVDAAFRAGEDGEKIFEEVKGLEIRFKPPEHAAITHGFIKIQREREVKDKRNVWAVELKEKQPFYPTVAYREFCSFAGDLTIAFGVEETSSRLESLLPVVGYFGKRGSFFQFVSMEYVEAIPGQFTFPLTLGVSYPSKI